MKNLATHTSNDVRVEDLIENSQTKQLMQLGRKEQWAIALLGIAPLPQKPVRLKDWLIVPAHLDNSAIPERALDRVQAIYQAGIRPKGFVLVHEAPMQLPAPETSDDDVVEGEFRELKRGRIEIDWGKAGRGVLIGSGILAAAAAAVVAVGAVLLPAAFIAGAAMLDPILIAVTEDDVWIEIDRWWV